jgi:hypothetical protein
MSTAWERSQQRTRRRAKGQRSKLDSTPSTPTNRSAAAMAAMRAAKEQKRSALVVDRPSIVQFVEQDLGLPVSPAQRSLLKAIYAETPDAVDLDLYQRCTGRTAWPTQPIPEIVVIAGARSGKDSRIACPIVCFEALYGGHEKHLIPGEPARMTLIAQDRQGAGVAMSYIKAAFDREQLRGKVAKTLADEIHLKNRISIAVHSCTKTSTRGFSIPCGILDEAAYFRLEGSANSDEEVEQAVRRGQIALPDSKLLIISTPYMMSGIVYQKHKEFFGVDSPDVLVWVAPTILMNPTVSEDRLARELRVGDPLRYKREYEASFVEPLTVFLSSAWVNGATMTASHELPWTPGAKHVGALDPSGGGQDAMTLAIVRADGDAKDRRITQVLMKAWTKPKHQSVDLEGAVSEAAILCKRYNVQKLYGDRFTGAWVQQAFRRHGISYEFPTMRTKDGGDANMDRSQIYLEAESLFAQGRIRILDHPTLARELKNLERRPGQGGRDRIDHPRGQHDDHANALCLAAVMARGVGGLVRPWGGSIEHLHGGDTSTANLENVSLDRPRRQRSVDVGGMRGAGQAAYVVSHYDWRRR